MTVPSQLQKLIQDALESVYHHPQHDLNLGYRQAIWAAFGDNGHLKRTVLALSTVRHVLPIWNQKFPHDDRPQQLLTLAEAVISGDVSKAFAEKEAERLWREMQQLGYLLLDVQQWHRLILLLMMKILTKRRLIFV